MHKSIRLLDPQGRPQATLPSSATPEDLLRAAFDLRAEDALVVCTVGPAEWSLAIYRAGSDAAVVPVGPKVGEVPRSQWVTMRRAMAETAWLDLVDAGWAVAAEAGSRTRSTTQAGRP